MKVVYAATRNLYKHLQPAIASLLKHNTPEMIYVLAEDGDIGWEIPAPHRIIDVSGQTAFQPDGPNFQSQFTYMAMMRILYVDLLPEEDRILQLDVDTIVCGDLEELWQTDMTGKWFAAVEEHFGRYKPFVPDYYNIGVCLFNLAQMRADGMVPAMVEDLNRNRYMCLEQDMLNKYGVPDKVVPLATRWNECVPCGMTSNPAVVHYAGFADWTENSYMPRWQVLWKYRKEAWS